MRVMFVARAIDGMAGGVERMVTTVMNALVERGHDVDLLTWDQEGARSFYPMDARITWQRLDAGDPAIRAGLSLRLRRARMVRALLRRRRPEVVVCFQDGPYMSIRAYSAGMGIPVIAAERNAPTRFDHTSAKRRQGLTYFAFRFAARVLIQVESYRELYPAFLRRRIVAIPNPVFPAACRARPAEPGPNGRFEILCIGRLGYQKNQLVLADAFAALAQRFPQWDLVLLGDGEDGDSLARRIAGHGLGARVSLIAPTPSPSDWYCRSHLFCLPSRWEGFPNALGEALARGLPAVGFAECAGVRDLIEPGRNGALAAGNGDSASLADTLAGLMTDDRARGELGDAAVASVAGYSPDAIFRRWESTLAEVAFE